MLRLVAHQEAEFTEDANLAFELLGALIETKPEAVATLLHQHNIVVSKQPGPKELTRKLLYLIEHSNASTRWQIAKAIANILPQQEYENFNQSNAEGPNLTVGADPVSAIAGAIGSIANVVNHAQNKKQLQRQASANTLNALFAFRASQQPATPSPPSNRPRWVLPLVGLGVLAALGWFFFQQRNAIPQTT